MEHVMHLIASVTLFTLMAILINDQNAMRPGIGIRVFAYMLLVLALAWVCVSAERTWKTLTKEKEE